MSRNAEICDGSRKKYVSPIVNGADPGLPLRSKTDLPTKDWNIVYMPYCTGDTFMGTNDNGMIQGVVGAQHFMGRPR